MKYIKYKGPYSADTGYGNAVKGNVKALLSVGYKVLVDETIFNSYNFFASHGVENMEIVEKDNDTSSAYDYDTVIIHAPVTALPELYEEGKRNIIYTTFEADKFPEHWVRLLKRLKMSVIVPSKYNKDALIKSRFRGSIDIVPHHLDAVKFDECSKEITLADIGDSFLFYSIFQWSARKNPEGLLKAYLTEFTEKDDVKLLLKLYGSKISTVYSEVDKIKKRLNLKYYPEIILYNNHLTEEEMIAFHKRCDCFVSLHHSEGFGLPIAEAMAVRNPVIVPAYSGNMQFCNPYNAKLVETFETPVYGQTDFPNWRMEYNGIMKWGEPNIEQAKMFMRDIYTDYKVNHNGFETIRDEMNCEKIGMLLKNIIGDN